MINSHSGIIFSPKLKTPLYTNMVSQGEEVKEAGREGATDGPESRRCRRECDPERRYKV